MRWRRNGPPALAHLFLDGHIEFRVKLNVWDVMMPVRYGYAVYPQRKERHPDLFSAIGALIRLNAAIGKYHAPEAQPPKLPTTRS